MKAIVGIDNDGAYASGLHWFKRLQFEHVDVSLLHACNPALIYAPFGVPAGLGQAEFFDAATKAGQAILDEAESEAKQLGFTVTRPEICLENASDALSHAADRDQDDIIVVGAHRRSQTQAMFLGSVSRQLAIHAPCSILVAKGEPKPEGKLRAIFATDHSKYADACLAKFLDLKPQGIDHIEVFTAYEIDDYEAALLHMELPKLGGMVDEWLEDTLEERGARVAAKLISAGYQTSVKVRQGKPNTAIAQEMQSSGADLLIIGAQGHGFLDKFLIGSVSLHQVMAEPYPVLLLRT